MLLHPGNGIYKNTDNHCMKTSLKYKIQDLHLHHAMYYTTTMQHVMQTKADGTINLDLSGVVAVSLEARVESQTMREESLRALSRPTAS